MTESRTRNILSICDQAMALDADAQKVFLQQACSDDPQLRDSVESIMRAVTAAGDFLETPIESNLATKTFIGSNIGPYRILEKLGEGGMGAVYLAERVEEDFTQRVAIKLIRHTLLVSRLIKRFNAERKILAQLNHPYIAALIDGGTTPEGIPYLVMEFVDGIAADVYCDQHRLDIPARIRLIQKVAMAVQAAHQNLIVHRDLKPSNVLVTNDGIPKLLDFGVAKLLQIDDVEDSEATVIGHQAFTPDFASPEQILENTVTTASDVYTLGVLSYQLIVGERPYHIETSSHGELVQSVENLKVPIASSRLDTLSESLDVHTIASLRETTAQRLRKTLAGDLDSILMKALERDPARRYDSVAAFSADLGRYLDGLPIEARPNSLAYRMTRFVARNKIGVAAAGALLVIMIAALAVTSWAYFRAEAARAESASRFAEVRAIANTMMFDVYDEVSRLPGATRARELLATQAQTYLDSLAASANASQDVRFDAGRGYERLAQVVGGVDDLNLGDRNSAAENYVKADKILSRLHTESPQHSGYAQALGTLQSSLAAHALYSNNDINRARGHAERSVAIFKRYSPKSDAIIVGEVNAMVELADTYDWEGEPAQAEKILKDALRLIESVKNDPAQHANAAIAKARVLRDYGDAIYWLDDIEGSINYTEQSVALYRSLLTHSDDKPGAERSLAVALFNLAGAQSDGPTPEDSLVTINEAMQIAERLLIPDPKNIGASNLLGNVIDQRVLILSLIGRHDEAIEQALENYHRQVEENNRRSEDAMAYRSLTIDGYSLAQAYMKADKKNLACQWLNTTAQRFESARQRDELTGYDEKTLLPDISKARLQMCQ